MSGRGLVHTTQLRETGASVYDDDDDDVAQGSDDGDDGDDGGLDYDEAKSDF